MEDEKDNLLIITVYSCVAIIGILWLYFIIYMLKAVL